MAFQDMPLSDLDSATSVGDSDLMYIVQGGVSKKATRGQATSGFAHLVNGTVPLSELPKTALDNLVKVANDTARFALTTAQVQNGDSVEVLSTDKMYLVVDDTKLDEEAGYKEYAATVDWSTIQGKPNNLVKSVPVGTPSGGAMSPILHESDVVDALNSSSTTSPLSANQGKNLKQNVDTLSQSLAKLLYEKTYTNTSQTWQTVLNDFYSNIKDIVSGMDAKDINRLKVVTGNVPCQVYNLMYVGSSAYHFIASIVNANNISLYGMMIAQTGSLYVNSSLGSTITFGSYTGQAISSARTLQLYLA